MLTTMYENFVSVLPFMVAMHDSGAREAMATLVAAFKPVKVDSGA